MATSGLHKMAIGSKNDPVKFSLFFRKSHILWFLHEYTIEKISDNFFERNEFYDELKYQITKFTSGFKLYVVKKFTESFKNVIFSYFFTNLRVIKHMHKKVRWMETLLTKSFFLVIYLRKMAGMLKTRCDPEVLWRYQLKDT